MLHNAVIGAANLAEYIINTFLKGVFYLMKDISSLNKAQITIRNFLYEFGTNKSAKFTALVISIH